MYNNSIGGCIQIWPAYDAPAGPTPGEPVWREIMENKSIFSSSYKILRRSKLAWLFSFIYSLGFTLLFLILYNKSLVCLSCFLGIILILLFPAFSLCLPITLYYEYLNKQLSFQIILNEIKKYILRWTVIIILVSIPLIIIYILITIPSAKSNYIPVMLIFSLFGSFFESFLLSYIFLAMIQNDLGIWEAIKQGTHAWAYQLDIKLGIAFVFTAVRIILDLLSILYLKRSLIIALTINYHDFTVLSNSILFTILNGIYMFLLLPISGAIITSLYFGHITDKTISLDIL
jgi:hypothetical protein